MAPIINFSGIASGIDSASLINALIDRERAVRVTPLEEQIASLTDTNDAFSELKSLLSSLQGAAQKFRAVQGSALSKIGTSSDETIATASAGNSAQNGTYSLTVNDLAKNATLSLGSTAITYASSNDAINPNINDADPGRTVTIELGQGSEKETVSIDLTSATTLADFVEEFNNESSKGTATLVNVGTSTSPNYRIVISSNDTGLSEGEITLNVGTEITDPDGNPGTNDGAFDSNELSQAEDASFSISGIGTDITRSSNNITDVISGVTFSLKSTGSTTITVDDDVSATTATLQEFVDAYNDLVTFITENDLITQEQDGADIINIFGPLSNTSIDENVITSIRSAFSSSSISGGLVNTLADLGIATQRDGTLAFDTAAFATALQTDAESVRTITQNLGETLAAVDGTIAQYTRFGGLIDVATNSNSGQVTALNERIAEVEASLSKQEETLIARYSRLEALIGTLNSQQSTLAQILPK